MLKDHSMAPKVIAFFGPDGAGKSTQANLLIDYFISNGFKVKKAWIRSTHTIAYILWLAFYKLHLCEDRSGMPRKKKNRFAISYLNERPYGIVSPITMSPPILKDSLSKWLWATIEIISIIPIIVLQIYLPLFLGRIVIAERFVVDSVTSIAYFLEDEKFIDHWQSRLLLKLIPKGTLFVFIDAKYETILSRRGEVAGPREYTEFHRRLYKKLSSIVGAFYIDTSETTIFETHRQILGFVKRYMN